jgi:hypothetical protein
VRPLALFSLTILLTGCVTWSKTGATQQDFDVDKAACESQAYSVAPSAVTGVRVGSGYNQPTYTNCTGYENTVNCTTTGGGYIPPPVIYIDQNVNARNSAFANCMYKNGWSTNDWLRHLLQ